MILKKNQILEVKIEDMNMMGFGVAKVDGAVIFVQNAVLGEKDRIKIIKCAKSYYVARIEECLSPSDFRVNDGCKFAKRCGGCVFQHISYDLEKNIKRNYVKNCLDKARLSDVSVLDVFSTGNTRFYRNKAQYPLTIDDKGKVVAGFYSPKTHTVCPVDRCLIQDARFSPIVSYVCSFLEEKKISIYSEELGQGLVRHVYLRVGSATGEIMLCLVLSENNFPNTEDFVAAVTKKFSDITSIVFNINPKQTNVILGDENVLLYGKEKICDILCENKLHLSPLAFYQVNRDGAELLYKTAFEMANLGEHDLLLDLYCGIGSISLSAGKNIPIIGVEIVKEAVEDANFNAKANNFNHAKFICGDAKDAFDLIRNFNAKNPLLIVDPPRKGLSSDLIYEIAKQNIQKVLYISCGPDTLGRDLSFFRELGFQFDSVQPVDMFPRTGHVETVVILSKR